VPPEWCVAEDIYVPKKKDSKTLDQFRPISLLNVDGKIFFGVMAKRLTDFVIRNALIDVSVQKAGVPGFPGCLEHAQMIWDTISQTRRDGSLRFMHVPEKVIHTVNMYIGQFRMRFTTKRFTTAWQRLEVGIPMGCTISPLRFVIVMEVVTRSAVPFFDGVVGPVGERPPIRAFMDDLTILCPTHERAVRGLQHPGSLIQWTRMKFKLKKSRSLSLRDGRLRHVRFVIGGEEITHGA
jgi:hypothetical protein